ncbi:MAG: sulfatase-like hydrolase/transferase [Acidobacteria bacterium]|nr:sulfatase-like hydrolase/transferase [Acidobacteriota bacterium]
MRKRETKVINRREFLGAAVAGTLAAGAAKTLAAQPRPASRPNVLFILADDLGWGDLSCYGRPDYRTPNLDRLAAEGARFTQAYSASPVCTPTRCAFLTGQYPARHPVGLMEPLPWRKQEGGKVGLDPAFPSVASLLRANGYETALVGKWHLGYLPKYGPLKSGFDEFYGIMSGAADFFTHDDSNGEPDFFENEQPVPPERNGYLTELLTDRAVEYIRRPRTRPFYLSLHYNAPHWPWEGPNDAASVRKPKRGFDEFRGGGSLKVYAEMMRSMDAGVGRALQALRDARVERDTLVVFTSDNGGERFSYNWPFVGGKDELLEGGIRVPAIVRFPRVVPAGRVSGQVAITMDWTATILSATGTPPDPRHRLDGIDLLPSMRGGGGASARSERTLFWRHLKQSAVRRGDLKYWHDGQDEYLFDLSQDVRENGDLKKERAREFEQLKAEFARWDRQVLPRKVRGE